MSTPDQLRLEEVRFQVRTYLYERQAVAQSAGTIRRGLSTEFDFSQKEVEAALFFLVGMTPPQVSFRNDDRGATKYWQITTVGILAHERR
jgi:hypothetical protein